MKIPRERGLTLIEVLVTLVILVFGLLGIAAFQAKAQVGSIEAYQRAQAVVLLQDMRARSEAVKRNMDVTLQPVTTDSWASGWTIPNPTTAGVDIEVHAALKDVAVTGPSTVVYMANGRIRGTTQPQFELTSSKGQKRCIDVDLSGRPYLKASACA